MFRSAKPAPNHDKAPSLRIYSCTNQLIGAVIANTNTTAAPRPIAVVTFLDTARKEHMPKK